MKRLSLLPLVLLLISTTAFGQTNSIDSDSLKSLLSEVRQLRRDLQTTTVATQRAQILIYRTQAQESVVRRMQERVDDTRSKLAQIQYEGRSLTAAAKQNQDLLDHTDNPTTRKELEQGIAQFKAHQEIQANTEQETRAKLSELEEELRLEQAELDGLQDRLDRLEKTLENSNASR